MNIRKFDDAKDDGNVKNVIKRLFIFYLSYAYLLTDVVNRKVEKQTLLQKDSSNRNKLILF